MTETTRALPEADVDRLRELANIGAGHAATALAHLIGRPCSMRVPEVKMLGGAPARSSGAARPSDDAPDDATGVFFEVQGGVGGVLALVLSAASCDRLIEHLVGAPVREVLPETAESALRELGNILVSHAVSAMSDTLGVAALPSVPVLVRGNAANALSSLIALRDARPPVLQVETELSDRPGAVRALLVFVPDPPTAIAAPAGF